MPVPQDQVLIDAISGKLLSKEGKFYDSYGGLGGGGDDGRLAYDKQMENKLSPAEEVAVEEAKNLLPMEKALTLAMSLVKVPQEYALQNSRLEQDFQFKEKKSWHFNWQSGDGPERKWIEAAVDASTGELVSFNNDYRDKFGYIKASEVKFSEDAARKIAGDFIRKFQPGKWDRVMFKSTQPELAPLEDSVGKALPRSYSFSWSRVANGVQFPENGFFLNVDSATGEVTGFRMTWWDVDFPNPEGVIGKDAAADKYLRESPLTLVYARLWPRDGWTEPRESKVYLIYRLTRQDFVMLDAFNGQTLNYEGQPVTTSAKKTVFEDLEGHPAREAVELLAGLGIVTVGDGKFRPGEAVTQAELITMLVQSSSYSPYPGGLYKRAPGGDKDPWYRPYYDAAARMGILQAGENPDPEAPVTREILARLTINAMGLNKAARLGDLYVLNFEDAGEIAADLRGYAALSAGLGLLQPAEGKFQPKKEVTRGEAAMTLVRLLNIERQRNTGKIKIVVKFKGEPLCKVLLFCGCMGIFTHPYVYLLNENNGSFSFAF